MYARKVIVISLVCSAAVSLGYAQGPQYPDRPLVYPKTKTVTQVDELHGVKVADPYRWLEDLDSDETATWVAAQNEVTFGYLEEIPARQKINQRITKLYNYEKYGTPYREGGRYFYSKNDGLQAQYVFYVTEALDGEPRVLLDPNKLSEDGTIALAGRYISHDGKLLAYGLSNAGSDWVEFKVRDVDTGADLDDHLKWIKFSGASWTKDNQGFYYSRFDEPQGDALEETNYYQKLCYHRLGTPQAEDRLVYHRPDQKEWGFGGAVTEDGRYLIISISQGTERKNRVYYQDLQAADGQTIELLDDFDAQYVFLDNDGPVFWFFTDLDAPRGRVIAIDTRKPEREHWVEIIPEAEETLEGVNVVNDMFVTSYLKDAHTLIRIFNLHGKHVREVALPGVGSASGFRGKRKDTETFYNYTSFNMPRTIYRYDMSTGQSTLFRRPKVDFDPDLYETKQVFYKSKDGTRVPMFITHKKGLKLDGNNPTFLYGYGGFNISLTPYFSTARLVWMEMGGVYVLANIRGGGEYGKAWHDAGRLHNKQNSFDDFIAAAQWLIANKYTRPEKLAIVGGSNGGTLVGACITQRPELFGACLPEVGVLDMLRFHKFTIGWAWTSDFGSPDDPEDFKVIYAYSPLHNIKPGTCYPATMATTADHDDRVVPAHSFKFISALQAAQACDNPVLIRIETKAGHGGGKPTQKIIEEISDEYAFLVRVLKMDASALRKGP
ncbi:MAG: S9 family peptidase [Phycisphaerae bacterium]|nr:S9 family peptidase [Phycisphaerae bacterium]